MLLMGGQGFDFRYPWLGLDVGGRETRNLPLEWDRGLCRVSNDPDIRTD